MSKKVISWLNGHPAIKTKTISNELGLGNNLYEAIKGRRGIPPKHYWAICKFLSPYNLTIDDYRLEYHEENDIFTAKRYTTLPDALKDIFDEKEIEFDQKTGYMDSADGSVDHITSYKGFIIETEEELIEFLK